jgi:hypothetical protein
VVTERMIDQKHRAAGLCSTKGESRAAVERDRGGQSGADERGVA